MNTIQQSTQTLPSKIGLIGTGMIGVSVLCALRERGHRFTSIAFDHSKEHLEQAKEVCQLDTCAESLTQVVENSDLVIVATPPRALQDIFMQLESLAKDVLITDVSSVKRNICNIADKQLKDTRIQFVPGHPIAGSERSGPKSASADLFKDCNVVLTPIPSNSPEAVQTVANLWYATGAERIISLSPTDHDKVFAYSSHIPHALAYIYVQSLAAKLADEDILAYSAGGFRDFARIAASDPQLWCDIFLANGDELADALRDFDASADQFCKLLRESDRKGLYEFCKSAATTQNKVHSQK